MVYFKLLLIFHPNVDEGYISWLEPKHIYIHIDTSYAEKNNGFKLSGRFLLNQWPFREYVRVGIDNLWGFFATGIISKMNVCCKQTYAFGLS